MNVSPGLLFSVPVYLGMSAGAHCSSHFSLSASSEAVLFAAAQTRLVQPLGTPCLCLGSCCRSCGTADVSYHTWLFYAGSGAPTQVLTLAQWTLYSLGHPTTAPMLFEHMSPKLRLGSAESETSYP